MSMLPQVPLTDAERAEVDARPEKLALGGAGGFQARTRPHCLVVAVLLLVARVKLCSLQRLGCVRPSSMLPCWLAPLFVR